MNLLWALDWWWRLGVIWWGWAWLPEGAAVWEKSWTEAVCKVCRRLYKACVAMLSSRFLPFISSLFEPSESIHCTCATPPLSAVSLEVEAMCTQVYTHKGMHRHTQLPLLGYKKMCLLRKTSFSGLDKTHFSNRTTKPFYLLMHNPLSEMSQASKASFSEKTLELNVLQLRPFREADQELSSATWCYLTFSRSR